MLRTRASRPSLRVCWFVLCAITLEGCGGAGARYAGHMQRGKDYLAQDNLAKAGIEFRNAIQIQPKSEQAIYYSGLVAEKRGDTRAAASLYQSALDINTEDTQARANLARIYLLNGASDQALKLIEPALVKHPDDPELLTDRAAVRIQLKEPAQARVDAEHAVKVAPTNENAVALLAAIYRDAGEIDKAIDLVSGSVARVPASFELREILVKLYLSSEKYDKAEQQMIKLTEMKPRELTYYDQLALYYTRAKRPDDAQRMLEKAVKAQPDSNAAKLTLVDFLTAQRSRSEAEKRLRQFISSDPENYDLQLGLGALQQRGGDVAAAIATYNRVIEQADTKPQALTASDRIAAIRVQQGDLEGARKLLASVLNTNARDNQALLLRARLELGANDPAAAITDLRAVLRDQPSSVRVKTALAQAYVNNGQASLAEQELRGAKDLAPDDADVRMNLAVLLAQTQRTDQAVSLLEETVQKLPTNAVVRMALIRTYLQARNFSAARTAAEDLKTLRPKDASGYYLAALAEEGAGKPDAAEHELDRALELQPDTVDVMTELVHISAMRGKVAQVLPRVQDLVQRSASDAAAVNLLGEVYFANKDLPKAQQTFSRAIELAPKWWTPYRNRAVAQVAAGDMPAAIATYQSAIKLMPVQPQLTVDLANLYEKSGRIDDAIASYEALYKLDPKDSLAANNLAMLLVKYKTDRASLDQARTLSTSFASSQDGNLLDTSGWVRFKRGEYADAVAILERAAEKAPGSQVIRYHLGMAELQAGQRERARTSLESALANGARFDGAEDARLTLARLKSSSG
jgi:Flp pilus assembly protein TadD